MFQLVDMSRREKGLLIGLVRKGITVRPRKESRTPVFIYPCFVKEYWDERFCFPC